MNMTKVGKFKKVSFDEFEKSVKDNLTNIADTGWIKFTYDKIKLPRRATKGSAGYDFKSPFTFRLDPGKTILIQTGISVKIEQGWFLAIFPRSGLGFKYRLRLDNTVGIIDSDYFYSDNEGHIMIKMTNCGEREININAGDGIAQGVFIPYGITFDDKTDKERNGGFGSTGK